MAATPPPYSPQEAQRRAQQAWRAQREAARAQRRYWRSLRRPSIAGPLLLIAIGVVALLIMSGQLPGLTFWGWYQRWWPALLIAVGGIYLAEWFWDRNKPYVTRHSTGGLVTLIVIAGLVSWGTAECWKYWGPLRAQFGEHEEDMFRFMGAEHTEESLVDSRIPAGAQVQIENPRGDVTVTASTAPGDGMLHVRARRTVYSNSEDETKQALAAQAANVTVNGTNVLVRVQGSNNGKSDLTIVLPSDAAPNIHAPQGNVSVEGLNGAVNANAAHGDVRFENLGGTAHARLSQGDFSAHAVRGDLSLEGRMNDVSLSEIGGKVLLDGDFFGDTHLERIDAPLHLHSSRTDIEVARLAGELTMGSSDLHLSQVQGPARIVTRSKQIDCSQVFGELHIENSNGDVSLTMGAPLGAVQVTSRNGNISLAVPPGAGFTIDAHAKNGEIGSSFPLEVSGNDSSKSLSGQIGKGGPRVSLSAEHGDIHLKTGDALPPLPPVPPLPALPAGKHAGALPGIPMPPLPPAPPGTVKHLRANPESNAQPAVQ